MDGMGLGNGGEGDALALARTPLLDSLMAGGMYTQIRAHGTYVGLPDNSDMGNSEVGHNALGAGRVFAQGAKLVSMAIESGEIFNTPTWEEVIRRPADQGKTLHFIGLLSDGNVHSHIKHLFRLIEQAAKEKLPDVKVHILLDGRDVRKHPPSSTLNSLKNSLPGSQRRDLTMPLPRAVAGW